MYSRRNHRSFNRLEQFDLTCEIGSTQAVIDTNAIVLFTLDYFCFTGPIKPLLVLVSICLSMIGRKWCLAIVCDGIRIHYYIHLCGPVKVHVEWVIAE